MTAPKPWSPAEDTTLRRLHGQGLALHSIAGKMHRSKATVAKHAEALGLGFDRTATASATAAAQTDAKARRAALGLALLGDLETSRSRLSKADSPREFQSAAQGLDALMRSYVNLLRQEPDDGGLAETRSIVGVLIGAIRASVEGDDRMNPTAPREA